MNAVHKMLFVNVNNLVHKMVASAVVAFMTSHCRRPDASYDKEKQWGLHQRQFC